MEFIKGKWYKSNVSSSGRTDYFYIKFKETVDDRIYGECIDTDDRYRSHDYWNSKEAIKQAKELGYLTDLSEIIPYLPKGHPDLVETNLIDSFNIF